MHSARPDLDLLGRAVLDQLPAFDAGHQLGVEPQHAVEPQHVRHEVVGEHRQLIEVVELSDTCTLKVGRGDLRALEEWNLASVVDRDVREAAPAGQRLDQAYR